MREVETPTAGASESGERLIVAPDAVMLFDPWSRARLSLRPSELDALRHVSGSGLPVGELRGRINSLSTLTRIHLRNLTGRDRAAEGGSEWIGKGWGRPGAFLDWVRGESRARPARRQGPPPVVDWSWDRLQTYASIVRLLTRRSGLHFSTDLMPATTASFIESSLRAAQLRSPWLSCGLVYQSCAGREPGVYRLRSLEPGLECVSAGVAVDDLLALCQGQHWILGGGAVVFLGFDPSWVEQQRPIPSHWYLSCLSELGRIGQLLVASCYEAGIVSRMTPALDEEIAARVFGMPADAEFCYLLKLGVPAEQHS